MTTDQAPIERQLNEDELREDFWQTFEPITNLLLTETDERILSTSATAFIEWLQTVSIESLNQNTIREFYDFAYAMGGAMKRLSTNETSSSFVLYQWYRHYIDIPENTNLKEKLETFSEKEINKLAADSGYMIQKEPFVTITT